MRLTKLSAFFRLILAALRSPKVGEKMANRAKPWNSRALHPAVVKHSDFESVLLTIWRQSLVENSRSVTVAGRTFPVRSVTRHRLKEVSFRFEGHEFRGSEPDPNTESRWTAKESEDRKVMQFVERGYYVGLVDDGRVYNGLYAEHLVNNRKMFVQSHGQNSESVRGEARAWLWHQWKERKPAYLTLLTLKSHDEMLEETSSYLIASEKNENWHVTIQADRIVPDDQATDSQHSITEKELLVATEVQRVEPTTDETHTPRVISEDAILPESKYRLQFLDYGSRTVATL